MDGQRIYNLLFAGVGGQGVLLAAEITALAAVRAGFDVKQTEVHGVSQRGGSVETHLRFGPQVWSPIVTPGEADVVIGLEKLEAFRFATFLRPGRGELLANDFEVIPASVAGAAERYPHDAFEILRERGFRIAVLPASTIARDLGDGRMANLVLTGALSVRLPIEHAHWLEVLRSRIPSRFLAANEQAFTAGRAALAQGSLASFSAVERSPQ